VWGGGGKRSNSKGERSERGGVVAIKARVEGSHPRKGSGRKRRLKRGGEGRGGRRGTLGEWGSEGGEKVGGRVRKTRQKNKTGKRAVKCG